MSRIIIYITHVDCSVRDASHHCACVTAIITRFQTKHVFNQQNGVVLGRYVAMMTYDTKRMIKCTMLQLSFAFIGQHYVSFSSNCDVFLVICDHLKWAAIHFLSWQIFCSDRLLVLWRTWWVFIALEINYVWWSSVPLHLLSFSSHENETLWHHFSSVEFEKLLKYFGRPSLIISL